MNAPIKNDAFGQDEVYPIEGMTCASCVRRVEQASANVPGVRSVAVNLAIETASVGSDGRPVTRAVAEAISGAGYAVPSRYAEIEIAGMTCASCVRRVEQPIAAVPGVTKTTVNLATERATIEAAGEVPLTGIEAAVRKAGYPPQGPSASSSVSKLLGTR